VIIKNPNKTAVKLFLVPYDLVGMEPGTKTFIRQRIFSAGPILDGRDIPQHTSVGAKSTLRYLIHLHICCTAKGRFYLYKNIRVVFANRVPDGKERLQNEIQYPEPRYSAYRPGRESNISSPIAPGDAVDDTLRRRSSTFLPPVSSRALGVDNGTGQLVSRKVAQANPEAWPSQEFHALPTKPALPENVSSNNPFYKKLAKGEPGYGSSAFSSAQVSYTTAEGLLARKLKGLGVDRAQDGRPPPQEEPY
jgi:hypothetical protein